MVGLLPHLLRDVTGENLSRDGVANPLLVAVLHFDVVVQVHHSAKVGVNQINRGVLGLVNTNLNLVVGVGRLGDSTLIVLEGVVLEVEGHLDHFVFLFYQACPDSFSISQERLFVKGDLNFFSNPPNQITVCDTKLHSWEAYLPS